MFSKKDDRKQETNVACIFAVLFLVTLVNIVIVIIVRALLDAVDEINEPVVTGEARERLTIIYFVFIMTFFFGCWCCCFCECFFCRKIPDCPSATSSLITNVAHKFISSHPSIRKRFSDEDDIEIEEVVVTSSRLERPPLSPQQTDRYAYENPIAIMHEMVESEAASRIIPPDRQPVGRTRSYSIDVSFK